MTREKLKPTPGPWRFVKREEMDDGSVYPDHIIGGVTELQVCQMESASVAKAIAHDPAWRHLADSKMSLANALLIAEAGTVHHECGLSPRELLEGYRELRKQLYEISDLAIKVDSWESFPQRPIDSACAALAKHKEV